jgi:hypothetical protein
MLVCLSSTCPMRAGHPGHGWRPRVQRPYLEYLGVKGTSTKRAYSYFNDRVAKGKTRGVGRHYLVLKPSIIDSHTLAATSKHAPDSYHRVLL